MATDRQHAQLIATARHQLVVRYSFRTFGSLKLDHARKATGRRIDLVVYCWSPDTSGCPTQKQSPDFCPTDEFGFPSRTESNENDFDCRSTSSIANNCKRGHRADRTGEVGNTRRRFMVLRAAPLTVHSCGCRPRWIATQFWSPRAGRAMRPTCFAIVNRLIQES